MAKQDRKIHMPGAFGGLMRYDSEYRSRFMISPAAVIGFLIAIAVFAILLRIFFPFADTGSSGGQGIPTGHGFVIPLARFLIGF